MGEHPRIRPRAEITKMETRMFEFMRRWFSKRGTYQAPRILSQTVTEEGSFIKTVTVYRNDGSVLRAPAGEPGKGGQGGRGGSVSISGDRATVTAWKHK